mmetsp:Transcript_76858/g.216054  ORF Transcript_76858/g.216054 Transcript_76858/m.216054 type:complete len:222 (+) Transcript_76858:272-937(+)
MEKHMHATMAPNGKWRSCQAERELIVIKHEDNIVYLRPPALHPRGAAHAVQDGDACHKFCSNQSIRPTRLFVAPRSLQPGGCRRYGRVRSRHHCLPRKLSQERLSSCHVPACEELQALGVQSNPSKEAQAEAPELDRQAETRREDNLHLGDEAEDGDEAQLPRHRKQCQLVGEERVLGDGGGARAAEPDVEHLAQDNVGVDGAVANAQDFHLLISGEIAAI